MYGEQSGMKRGLFVLIVIFTVLMSGCAVSYHDYSADYQQVSKDPSLSDQERKHQLADLQTKIDDQNADKALARTAQEQWLPSEIIGGVCLVVLIGALIARGVQADAARRGRPRPKAAPSKNAAPSKSKAPSPGDRAKSGGPPGVSAAPPAPWDAPATPVKTPEVGQAAVDAIPEDQRGIAFFTSRPLSLDNLVEIPLMLGGRLVTVLGMQEEADAVAAGRIPRVRALSTGGVTHPWYEWPSYVPHRDYWPAADADWVWRGGAVVASWLSVDRIDPSLAGYLGPLPEPVPEPEAVYDAPYGLRYRKANITLTARRLPHLKVRALKSALAPVPSAYPVPQDYDSPPRRWKIKTGIRQPWVYHVRSRPKKSSRSAFA